MQNKQRRHTPAQQKPVQPTARKPLGIAASNMTDDEKRMARQVVKMCNVIWTHHGKPKTTEAMSLDIFAAVNALAQQRG